ncbi:MAG TPA: hypothetical protein VHC43_15620 [Mycobacteriales bacterium]|nr:hypothetical protein [Mycobacteriales bacterium]
MNKPGLLVLTASAGAAIVTAVGPAAAVTPHDASPVASSDYSLSIAVAQQSIAPGASDTVSGVLTKAGAPQPGDTVYLRARTNGRHHRAHRVGSATTGADGTVSFTVTPKRTTHYRLVFRESASVTPTGSPTPVPTPVSHGPVVARSGVATIHVVRETTLSIRAREARRGELLAGELRTGRRSLPGRKVTLQERAAGSESWTPVRTERTRRHGVVVFRVALPSAPEEYQLSFAGGPNLHASQSAVVTIG